MKTLVTIYLITKAIAVTGAVIGLNLMLVFLVCEITLY